MNPPINVPPGTFLFFFFFSSPSSAVMLLGVKSLLPLSDPSIIVFIFLPQEYQFCCAYQAKQTSKETKPTKTKTKDTQAKDLVSNLKFTTLAK